jgi:hypothetical protein
MASRFITVILYLLVGASVASAQYQRSVTLSPSQPIDSWPVTLSPDESASYSINIVDSASYVLAQSDFFKNFSNPDFLWSGGGSGRNFAFYIANANWVSGEASAKVECAWRPVGGPGPGPPPPWIYGEADSKATALPAEFIVEPKRPVPAVVRLAGSARCDLY